MASVPTETLGLTTTTPPAATPLLPFGPWADLPADLLHRVGDILHELKCYASARGTCAAWRRMLTPPTPSLLVVFNSATDGRPVPNIAFAASLPMRRPLSLRPVPSGGRWVGSSNGWLAHLALLNPPETPVSLLSLLNPVTGAEISLPALMCVSRLVSKIVFDVNTSRHDFIIVAMFDVDRLACIVAGDKQWTILDPVRLDGKDHLADLIYHKEGMVYCLTRRGDVYVVHLPKHRHGQTRPDQNALPTMVEPLQSLAHLLFDPTISSAPPYDMVAGYTSAKHLFFYMGNMYLFPRNASFAPTLPLPAGGHHRVAETGPNPNAPVATIEPLLSSTNLPFDPTTSFAPPYDTISGYTSAKNLASCQGNLYQIWRNTSCMVTLSLPAGGRRRVGEDEIFVLKYYPQRQPCWDAVTDLGGYSVFVGRNNAVSMYAQGVPGLKGDCVYWIGGRGRDRGMVFDMETKRSTPCLPTVAGVAPGPPGSTICWYFLSDKVVKNRNANA